jgi:hypothetical protein
MSRTYDIACDQCKVALWIGQAGSGNERGYIYTDAERLRALNQFLWDHVEHPLVFKVDWLNEYKEAPRA